MSTHALFRAFVAFYALVLMAVVPSVLAAPTSDIILRDHDGASEIFAPVTPRTVLGDPEISCAQLGPADNHAWGHRIQQGANYLKRRPEGQMCGHDGPGEHRISCSYDSAIYISTTDGGPHEMRCNDAGQLIDRWLDKCYYIECHSFTRPGFRSCLPRGDNKVEGYLAINNIKFTIRGDHC